MVRKKSKCTGLVVLLSLATWTNCQLASSRNSLPLSVGALAEEYERSKADVRNKYDGKEITVSGNVSTTPTMARALDEEGSVMLEDPAPQTQLRVACWFSQSQAEQFSRIQAGQVITVKGVFNGEAGVDLKFCKLVKID